MRALLGIGLMLGMTCAIVAADEEIDVKKLIGRWTQKEGKEENKFVVQFAKEGKLSIAGTKGDEKFTMKGTYKVEGNKLVMTMDVAGQEKTMTRIVSKLTETELVSKDEGLGKESTLIRLKEKKDEKD